MFSIVTKNRKPQINLPIKPSSINGGPPLAQLFRHCVCVCDELPTHSIKSQLNLERFLVPTELIGKTTMATKKTPSQRVENNDIYKFGWRGVGEKNGQT